MSILLDVLNVGLAEDLGGRLLEATARELDFRVKEALIGDRGFSLGGIARQQLTEAITKFTGKYCMENTSGCIESISGVNVTFKVHLFILVLFFLQEKKCIHLVTLKL